MIRVLGGLTWLSLLFLSAPLFAKKNPSLVDRAIAKVEESLVMPPKDGEACFSPEEPCDVKLWKFIRSATQSLDIAVYDVTHPKIVHEILVASKRLPVRVIVDRRQSKGEHSLVSLLVKGGTNVRFGRQRGVMHNKFALVDGTRLQTGSFNYTVGAAEKNQENQLYLSQLEIVERYRSRFETMWQEAKPAVRQVSTKKEPQEVRPTF